jgi:hypothetical protein
MKKMPNMTDHHENANQSKIRCHFTPVRMATIKKKKYIYIYIYVYFAQVVDCNPTAPPKNNKCWCKSREMGTLITIGGNVSLQSYCGKQYEVSSKTQNYYMIQQSHY